MKKAEKIDWNTAIFLVIIELLIIYATNKNVLI